MRFAVLSSEAERRDGLKALLRQINRQARFCEARDWAQTYRALRRAPVELLVVDWHDAMRAFEVRAALAEHPGLRVAVLIDDASAARVRPLMDEGGEPEADRAAAGTRTGRRTLRTSFRVSARQ